MHIIHDAIKILIRGFLIGVLHGPVIMSMEEIRGILARTELKNYFFGSDGAYRWFQPNAEFCMVKLVHEARIPINIDAKNDSDFDTVTQKSMLAGCVERYADKGRCTYGSRRNGEALIGFDDGSVLVEDKSGPLFYGIKDVAGKPVSACIFGHSDSPDDRPILIGHSDGSLGIMDRKIMSYSYFPDLHRGPITRMLVGPLPNMLILGGDYKITIMRFIQGVPHSYFPMDFVENPDVQIQGIRLYKCGIFVERKTDPGIYMPYSSKDYNAIDGWQFSPKQITCVQRLIAAKKAGTTMLLTADELPAFDALPLIMRNMLLKPAQ
jgi:hypothetical protein